MRATRLPPLILLLCLAACSSSRFAQPRPSAFSSGSCRALAPSVLALGKDLHQLGSKTPDDNQRTALKDHQGELRMRQAGLPAELAPIVQTLVTTVGVVRLRTDTHSYTAVLADDAMSAYRKVVAACTTS